MQENNDTDIKKGGGEEDKEKLEKEQTMPDKLNDLNV